MQHAWVWPSSCIGKSVVGDYASKYGSLIITRAGLSKQVQSEIERAKTLPYLPYVVASTQRNYTKDKTPGEQTSVIPDPSPFTSSKRLLDLGKSLSSFSTSLHTETRLILPSLLLQELESLTHNRTSDTLPEIIKKWLPSFYSADHIRLISIGLSADTEYLRILRGFLESYKPIPASQFVAEYDRIGEATILREEVKEKLGEAAGEVLFEVLATAYKTGALMVSFGENTYNLARRFGEKTLKLKSEVKDAIKRNAGVRRALRLAGYGLSLTSVQNLVLSLGLNLQYPGDIGIGLIIIADG